MRCRGYKHPPSVVYRRGQDNEQGRFYGLGKCAECGRVIGLAPRAGTIVMHKSPSDGRFFHQ